MPGRREKQAKGTQEDISATWLEVLGFMVIGLVSKLSWANHSDSGFFLVAYHSAKMDSSEKDSGRLEGRLDQSLFSPFDLS